MTELRKYIREELIKRYPNSVLVNDGILDPEIFKLQHQKVVFLLKETFGGYTDIEGRQEIYNHKSSPFWPNIFNWTNAVSNSNSEFYPKGEIREITNYIDNVAYVNIKKVNENKKKSIDKDILEYARRDSDLLRCQIDKINPNIIFTSNTTQKAYRIIYKGKDLKFSKSIQCGKQLFELYFHRNRSIIKSFHPSAYPVKQEESFKAIKELIS